MFSYPFQHVIPEPFDPSPLMPGVAKGIENDFNVTRNRQQREQTDADLSVPFATSEKENNSKENNVAKIKVVVS